MKPKDTVSTPWNHLKLKLKSLDRTLQIGWRNHMRRWPTGLHLLPTARVENWLPKSPFYHVSFAWLCWTLDVWWLNDV